MNRLMSMKISSLLLVLIASGLNYPCLSLEKQVEDAPFEIKAAVPNQPRSVLKSGKHFLVMDEMGLMPGGNSFGYGLYCDDTRYLSEWDLRMNGESPVLLSASTEDGYAGTFVYGNKTVTTTGQELSEQSVVAKRDVVITDAVYERLVVTNYGAQTAKLHLKIQARGDFADIFEVRGSKRKRRGRLFQKADDSTASKILEFRYEGLDKIARITKVSLATSIPYSVSTNALLLDVELPHHVSKTIELKIATSIEQLGGEGAQRGTGHGDARKTDEALKPLRAGSFEEESKKADDDYRAWRSKGAGIKTDNIVFNQTLERGFRDLYILRQSTPKGNCIAAGIPWYAVAFGRDQEITGLETLTFFPEISKEVISTLAAYQGSREDSFTEERPGKIMHELRLGEMANMKEIPFIPYYGTVDATPLWIVLLGRYLDRTGDVDFARDLWSCTAKALNFLQSSTKNGYLRYGGNSAALTNQGWKDSADSVMYSDGSLAKPPIALSEVQGYLYDALRQGAKIAQLTGRKDDSLKLAKSADDLKAKFNKDFWMTKASPNGFVALALDGKGQQCDVVSSNPGHLLASGVLDRSRQLIVGQMLMEPAMFSGWGIRTLSSAEQAYNPISYHNGSVWPHDNSLIVGGLYAIGLNRQAHRVFQGMFEAAKCQPSLRLPELFCGFSKDNPFPSPEKIVDVSLTRAPSNSSLRQVKPVWYPVSCAPQAWAAAAPISMLASSLGLRAHALEKKLCIESPDLPPFLNTVEVSGLTVGDATVSLRFSRSKNNNIVCSVLSKHGELRVEVDGRVLEPQER